MTVFNLNRERAAVGRSGHWLASALAACLFLSSTVAALAAEPATPGKPVLTVTSTRVQKSTLPLTLQANGNVAVEPVMDVNIVGQSIVYMANLPLSANVMFHTVMATQMPFAGRG